MPGRSTVLADAARPLETDTETFANADSNPVKIANQAPGSTFSIDGDTATYAVVRNSLTKGQLPGGDAVGWKKW